MDNENHERRAEATRQGESVKRNEPYKTSVGGYTMPQCFNGMDLPDSWRCERRFARLMLQTNPAAVALQKALDELSTPEAKTLKLKLGITDPEQD